MHNWSLSFYFGSCEVANCYWNKKSLLLLVTEHGYFFLRSKFANYCSFS